MIEHLVNLKSLIKKDNGDAFSTTLLVVFIVIYLVMPTFAAVIEKQIFSLTASNVEDAMEISCIATYNSLESGDLSRTAVNFDSNKLNEVFKKYLAKNLKLNDDLTPKTTGNMVKGPIIINSLQAYISDFPQTCEKGNNLTRPSIHVIITVPVEPTLYKYTILELLGIDKIYCPVHLDVELPTNQ